MAHYEKTINKAKEFYVNVVTENCVNNVDLKDLKVPTELAAEVFNDYVVYVLLIKYPSLRYTKRKEFIEKCYMEVMVNSLKNVFCLENEKAAKVITKYSSSSPTGPVSMLLAMYCKQEYGDMFNADNWKGMLNMITDRSFKKNILRSIIINLDEDILPVLFGSLSTALIIWNIFMR